MSLPLSANPVKTTSLGLRAHNCDIGHFGALAFTRAADEETFNTKMATPEQAAAQSEENRRRRSLKKFSYRGVDIEQLLDIKEEDFIPLLNSRGRRKFRRGTSEKTKKLMEKVRKVKAAAGVREKPALIRTHIRDAVVVPEMLGTEIAVYNGKVFNVVEVRPEMLGRALGEFSITYKPVKRKNPSVNTPLSKMISLK